MRSPLRIGWDGVDRHRSLRVLAVAGLLTGAAIAVFGLPPIALHSPLRLVGMVCPLCGGTRAVQSLMRGDLAEAWRYNPIAFAVVPGALAVLIRHAVGLVGGRWLNVSIVHPRVFYGLLAVPFLALWIHQATHAHLLLKDERGPGAELLGVAMTTLITGAASLAYFKIVDHRLRRGRETR
jgi:hypothetical protein